MLVHGQVSQGKGNLRAVCRCRIFNGGGKATDAEEGKAIDEKKPAEDEIDNSSTVSPSSDAPSEPSINGDVENASNASTPALAVVKALSDQNI